MNNIFNYLDELIPSPRCELKYKNNFEFLVAVILSAQTTDKKVNEVTKVLFSKYDINSLKEAKIGDISNILKPIGMANKKARYIIEAAKIVSDIGYVPKNKKELMKIPGVGNKTANVVLATLYNKPYFGVDTHVKRVTKRLGLVDEDLNEKQIENEMYKLLPKNCINRIHHQLVLFGRYYCTSNKPKCDECGLKFMCKKND